MRKRVQKQTPAQDAAMPAVEASVQTGEKTAHGIGDAVVKEEQQQYTEAVDPTLQEKRRLYLDGMLANTSDVIIALDQNFRIFDLNSAALSALAVPAEQAVGYACTEVLCCQNLNLMRLCGTSSCPLTRVMQQKQPLSNEELIIGHDPNHLCEVSTSVTPVHIGDTLYAIFNARDMSALKIANRVRANFVSMVSHELRTPLNSVHGFIDLLLQGHMGELTEEQHMYLGYTQEGVLQLVSIVEDILFMTRSDLGQFEVKQQEVHFRGLVRQIVQGLRLQAQKAEVELCEDIASDIPPLYVDPQRLKQVLNNLLANAIKFTPPSGTVTVSARLHDERFEMISVSDSGYGIPPEDRQHVFERFYQSNHSQQSKMGGYGLGLSIAKLIVEQHGGTIGFDTVLNKGTTFYFTVPLYRGQK